MSGFIAGDSTTMRRNYHYTSGVIIFTHCYTPFAWRSDLDGGSYFLTSQVIDLACGKPDCGFVYWVQAIGMARRSKAFCWRGVGRVRTVKGRSGAMAVTTVLRARVARSASRLWKLWTGAPSAVLPVAFLATARGERCALATGLSRNAAAASLSSSS